MSSVGVSRADGRWLRLEVPMLTEFTPTHCPACGHSDRGWKRIFRRAWFDGSFDASVWQHACRDYVVLRTPTTPTDNGHQAQRVELAERREKAKPPSIEDVMVMMQERWNAALGKSARAKAEVAVGLRFKVFMRDNFRCRYCGKRVEDGAILHADHVQPASKGGPTTLENLVTACIDCNLGKSDSPLEARAEVSCSRCGVVQRSELRLVAPNVSWAAAGKAAAVTLWRHTCGRFIAEWGVID